MLGGYDVGPFFDEMLDADGAPRSHYRELHAQLSSMTPTHLGERIEVADAFFLSQGIGFTVYGDDAGTDRIFPFDLVPQIVPADEWSHTERGLAQLLALNLFLTDIYHEQRSAGIPCRYVSGYLFDPGATGGASASHAWVDVYDPVRGWVSLDPTHDTEHTEHYVRVAVDRDYADVPPTRGVYRGSANETLDVDVRITPL